MIENIIDNRGNKYSVKPINAIIEPSCNDNSCNGATQFPTNDPRITTSYEERKNISIREAIKWGNTFKFPVTLYLYDDFLTEEAKKRREKIGKLLGEALVAATRRK